MQHFNLDNYVVDVLMPDLVGHDRRPAAFIVYLYFLRHAAKVRRDSLSVSLQTIATKTGLVQIDRPGRDSASAPTQAAGPRGFGDGHRPGSTSVQALESLTAADAGQGLYCRSAL